VKSFRNFLASLSRNQKIALQLLVDAAAIVFCFAFSMLFRLDSLHFVADPLIWAPVAVTVPVTLAALSVFGLYRSLVRYVTGHVLLVVAKGVFVSAIALMVSASLLDAGIPRSVPAIYAVHLFLLLGGLRFVVRHFFRQPANAGRVPVIIYGAGEGGRQLLNSLFHGRDYAPVAFVDDAPALQGMSIGGHRVHAPDAIPRLAAKTGARVVLLAMPSISRCRRRQIIESLEGRRLEIKTVPGISDVISGKAKISELRAVTAEDLLGREPVAPDDDLLHRDITGKVVMVSGAGGSIGSELCRQILPLNPAVLVLYEMSEFALYAIEAELTEMARRIGSTTRIAPVLGSVQHTRRVEMTIGAFGVQTIYHAAAYKHVPLVEDNIVEGIRNNVFGTLAIATAAGRLGVGRFILISTDKAVRPANVMGATKRIAELICQALSREHPATVFSMVRFGNVLGSSGSVIPRFQAQIERGGPVTVTHPEITRYFMTIPEAAQLVIQAGAMARGGDVFVLDMGEPVRIMDLAVTMIKLHGLTPYTVDHADDVFPEEGDIPIHITGLRKGEKLYEELLIGNDPAQTSHPRIMTASEVALPKAELMPVLDRLLAACMAFEVPAILRILRELPLAYRPTSAEVPDLLWSQERRERTDELSVAE